jgi:hypothetical protein
MNIAVAAGDPERFAAYALALTPLLRLTPGFSPLDVLYLHANTYDRLGGKFAFRVFT